MLSPRGALLLGKASLVPGVVLRSHRAATGPRPRGLLAAQVLSWGGDLALCGESRRAFAAGLGSFLGAQVAYVATYRRRSSTALIATPGRRRFLAAGTGPAVAMGVAAAREDPALALPVAAYGVALTAMVTAAAAVDAHRGRDRLVLGSVLFMTSDLLIGVRCFVLGPRRGPVSEAGVAATYAAAQWLIADAMARA